MKAFDTAVRNSLEKKDGVVLKPYNDIYQYVKTIPESKNGSSFQKKCKQPPGKQSSRQCEDSGKPYPSSKGHQKSC